MESASSPPEDERFVLSVIPVAPSQRVRPPVLRRARLVVPPSSSSTNASTTPNQSSAGPSPASILPSLASAPHPHPSDHLVQSPPPQQSHPRQPLKQPSPAPQNLRTSDFFNLDRDGSHNRRTHSAGTLLQTTESPPHTPSSAKGVAGTGEALDKSSLPVQPAQQPRSEETKTSSSSLRFLEGSSEHLRQIVSHYSLSLSFLLALLLTAQIKEKDEFIVSLVSLLGRYYLIGKKSPSWEVPEQERNLLSDLTKQADKVLAQFFDK